MTHSSLQAKLTHSVCSTALSSSLTCQILVEALVHGVPIPDVLPAEAPLA